MKFRQPSAEEKTNGLGRDSEVGVFLMEVKVAQDITSGVWQAQYSGSGEAFLSLVPEVIDLGLQTMTEVPQLEGLVMHQFERKTDKVKVIDTIHPTDPMIMGIKEALTEAMKPFGAHKLEQYRELIVGCPSTRTT